MKNLKKKKEAAKIGKFQTIFKGALFGVRQAEAIFPSGKKGVFETAYRLIPSVSILALDQKGRLLFNREYRPYYKKRLWRLPGGDVKKGESIRAAAQRELQEEAGFKAQHLSLFHSSSMGQTLEWQRHAFLAKDLIPSKLPVF